MIMRNIYSVVIMLAMMAGFSSCSNGAKKASERGEKITEPEQIGQQVFNILKNIEYKSEDGDKKFAKNFLSYSEVMGFGENESVSNNSGVKDALATMTEEEWTETIYQVYIDMLSWILLHDVNLGNIKYKDFIYDLVDLHEGGKFLQGRLIITHKARLTTVNSS